MVENVVTAPRLEPIQEDVSHSCTKRTVTDSKAALEPDPYKPGATPDKSVTYAGNIFKAGRWCDASHR